MLKSIEMTFSLFLLILYSFTSSAKADARAEALLRAVCDARKAVSKESLAVEYRIQHLFSLTEQQLEGLNDKNAVRSNGQQIDLVIRHFQHGEKRFFAQEQFGKTEIWLFDGEFGWHYFGGVNSSLSRTSKQYFEQHSLEYIASFGLLPLLVANLDLDKKVLAGKSMQFGDATEINGVLCYQIIKRVDSPAIGKGWMHYFIEEPRLRVHKSKAVDDEGKVHWEVVSIFSKGSSWLPEEIEISDFDKPSRNKRITDIKILDRKPTDKDFTLQAAGIPIGTTISDQDQKRLIGYWTGSAISEQFVSRASPSTSSNRLWWLLAGLAVIVVTFSAYRWIKK